MKMPPPPAARNKVGLSLRQNLTFQFALAATFFLTACAGQPEIEKQDATTPAPEPATEMKTDTASEADALPRIELKPPERVASLGLPTSAVPNPLRLIGLNAHDILKSLGPPDFKRHDKPAEIWQYRRPGCLLDLFLYETGPDDDTLSVRHVEARGHDITKVSDESCFLEALNLRSAR